MAWSRKRKAKLVEDLRILLDDLCIQWGFCTHLKAKDFVGNGQVVEADAFAVAILEAEGLNPETSQFRDPIRKKFTERYGASVSTKDYASRGIVEE